MLHELGYEKGYNTKTSAWSQFQTRLFILQPNMLQLIEDITDAFMLCKLDVPLPTPLVQVHSCMPSNHPRRCLNHSTLVLMGLARTKHVIFGRDKTDKGKDVFHFFQDTPMQWCKIKICIFGGGNISLGKWTRLRTIFWPHVPFLSCSYSK